MNLRKRIPRALAIVGLGLLTAPVAAAAICGLEPDCFLFLGSLQVTGETTWGEASRLTADQGGSIEIGNSLGSGNTPYIDFHYGQGAPQDFNMRIINSGDRKLSILGGSVGVGTWVAESTLDVRGFGAFTDKLVVRGGVEEGGQIVLDDKGIQDIAETSSSWNIDSFGPPLKAVLRIFRHLETPALQIEPESGRMTVNGLIRSGNGFIFSDGSIQLTAAKPGPRGRRGPPGEDLEGLAGEKGPPGTKVRTRVRCVNATKGERCATATILGVEGPCSMSSSEFGTVQCLEGGICCLERTIEK
jgi:hypothetical protein